MYITSLVIFLIFAALVGFFVYNYHKTETKTVFIESDKIKTLNDRNFEHEIKKGIMLVEFWGPSCMSCSIMGPVLNEISEEISGNVLVGKFDVDQEQDTSSKYDVSSIPTMLLFKNGKEINRFVGIKSKDFLLKEIAKIQ